MSERDDAATVQVKVRMKEPLRLELESAAKEHGVSMNGEIVHRLEKSFERERRIDEFTELLGGKKVFPILQFVGNVLKMSERSEQYSNERHSKDWAHVQWMLSASDILRDFANAQRAKLPPDERPIDPPTKGKSDGEASGS